MNKDLITTLKDLKNIQPDADYSRQSKMLILSSPQNTLYPKPHTLKPILNWFDLKHSLMTATALATLAATVFLAISYLPGNKYSLVAEANEINASIQVKLNEVQYYLDNQEINASIANDVQNLLKTTADDLIKAQEELKFDPDKIKEAVDKIKEAESAIAKINKLLVH